MRARVFVLFFCGFPFITVAQTLLKGQVLDEKTGDPLPGARVVVKQTQSGAVSATDGSFSLSLGAFPVTLSVSFIGYHTKEQLIKDARQPVVIKISENADLLNEVVVVGYGTQKRKELTGSVASLAPAVLEQPAVSFDAFLGGAIAGLNVTQTSGQPGAASSLRIRGGTSLEASNDPLYVIDGFIFFHENVSGITNVEGSLNPLAFINPSDIESIEILKDVSAKAIYGSRGSNGVILVTTHKGKRDGNTIRYQVSVSADRTAKKLQLLDAQQWADYANAVSLTNGGQYLSSDYLSSIGKGYDWQDAVLQTGISKTHELSISGGDDHTRYLLSGNYTNQQGIILHSGFERYSGRINLDRELSDHLSAGITATAGRSLQDALTTLSSEDYAGSSSPFKSGITNSLVYALFVPPVIPIYDATQSDGYNHTNPFEITELNYYGTAANPVADLETSLAQTASTVLFGNFYAKYQLPWVEGLAFKFNAGVNINSTTQTFFAPPLTALGINADIQGRATVFNRRTDVSLTEYLLSYNKWLNEANYLDLMAAYTHQKTASDYLQNKVTHISSIDRLDINNEDPEDRRSPQSLSLTADLVSWLGRINYTLLGRYNLTATFRADYSTRFAAGHEWGKFPSLGLSWNINEEPFYVANDNLTSVLNNLKLRATWGKTGNQEIGFDEYSEFFNIGSYNGSASYNLTRLNNPDLKWETTTEYNLGIDAALFDNRLNITADAYYKRTDDLLSTKAAPLGSGTGSRQIVNFGNLTNKGVEFAVNARLIDRKHLAWTVDANIARNINTITKLSEDNLTTGDNQEQIYRVGESYGSFYGYVYEGVDPQTGEIKLSAERTVLGSIQPDFTYGLSSSFRYRQWDLFLAFQGSYGNEVYNKLRRHLSENNKSYNRSIDVLDAWTPTNTITDVPSLDAAIVDDYLYSRYVEDGSYLRLKTLTLAYSFDRLRWIPKVKPVSIKLFVTMKNLFTLTAYKGYDPEIASGIDTGVYPASKSIIIGTNFIF
jgi:TonB-linked SusC/RagA family outer membrane protein